MSYNKWTGILERLAGELPAGVWGEACERKGIEEMYTWVRHMPTGMSTPQQFATCRCATFFRA